jgi:two-component system, OmpR family, alkaline phosphatase synthesis response regulator PhoP
MADPKRILLIDDDEDLVLSTRLILEAAGYRVDSAADGDAGLAAAEAHKPDLVLLDVMMRTDTEGLEISRKFQKNPKLKGLPVVLLTGVAKAMNLPFKFEPDDELLPVKAVIEKPVRAERLLETVKRFA